MRYAFFRRGFKNKFSFIYFLGNYTNISKKTLEFFEHFKETFKKRYGNSFLKIWRLESRNLINM